MKAKRFIQSLFVMMLLSLGVYGQDYNELNLRGVNGMRGKTISVPVYLENSSEITSLQFDITLPGGSGYKIYPDSSVIAPNRKVDHVISGVDRGGYRTRFMIYSPTNSALRGNSGKICDVVFKIPTSLDDSQLYDIKLTNVIMSDKNGTNVFTNSTDAKLSLVSYPDFEVSNLKVTGANITPGGTITMSWLVKNIGETASTGGWKESFYLVNDEGQSVYIGNNNFDNSGIAPGGSVSRSITLDLPSLLGIDGTVKAKVSLKGNSDSGERYEQEWNNSATAETGVILNRTLSLTLPETSVLENRGKNIRCQLSRSGNKSAEETFNISYTNQSRIEMPTSVTIGRNQSTVTFYANVIDNDVYNEDSIVNITASGTGYNSVSGRIIIEDNEYPDMTLTSSKEAVNEGETFTLTVSLPKAVNYDIPVSFTSENSKLFDMPSTVTIKAGKKSESITVTVLQNDLPEVETAIAFFATATKYNKAQCIVVKEDDDMPVIEMTISPTIVSESAGPVAVSARLVRKTLTDRDVTITFSDDNEGNIYYSNRRITMPAGATTAEFSFGVVDNSEVDGDRIVNISAGVYAKACNCSASGTVTGASTVQLKILDNDGPTLAIKSSRSSLIEGKSDATVLTVTRNTGTSGTTVVKVTSDHDSDLTYTATATIPNGSNSVEIPVGVKANDTPDDERTVVFTVTANGYTQGTCFALITDQSIPDALISDLSISSDKVPTLGKAEVSVTVENAGNQPLPSQTPVNVYMKRDGEITLMTTIYTQSVIAAGESGTTTKTVTMPDKAGVFKVYGVVNEEKKVHELIYTNNTSAEIPFSLTPSFTATVETDKAVYNQSENIMVTGQLSGTKISNVEVEVYFINNNIRNIETVTSDAQGRFSLNYNTKSVGGHYIIGACYPDERLKDAMVEVDVYGLRRTTTDFRKHQPTVGIAWDDEISITNSCPLTQTNITAELLSTNDDIDFSFTPVASIGGNGQAIFKYTLLPTKASTGDQWSQLQVRVKSEEGAYFDFTVYYYNRSPRGKIKTDVTRINTTMTKGQSRDYPIDITNIGNGATGKISLLLPKADWLTSVTPIEMPSMETTDTTTIILRFTPTDDMPLNVPITGTIGINCETGDGMSLPFSIEPVSESNGKLIIDVTDEYTYFTDEKPHVKGAKVKVTHPTTGRVIAEGETGDDGLFVVDEIPEGYYSLYVTADSHDSYRNNILVDPGKDTEKEVFLSFNPISVSWDVVETEVEDVYNIVTTVKYETFVPAPVITVQGETNLTSIQKLNVGESEIYYYTYTNEGLITAMNFNFLPIGDADGISGDFKYEILNAPPLELAPQQQYVAALKITRLTKGESKQRAPMMREGGKKVGCIQYMVAMYEYFCKQMNTRGVTEPLQIDTDCGKFLNGYVEGGSSGNSVGNPVGTPSGYGSASLGGYGYWGGGNDCPDNSVEKWNAAQNYFEHRAKWAMSNHPFTKPWVVVYNFFNKTERKINRYRDWINNVSNKNGKNKASASDVISTWVTNNPIVYDMTGTDMDLYTEDKTVRDNTRSQYITEALNQLSKDDQVRSQFGTFFNNSSNYYKTWREISSINRDFKEMAKYWNHAKSRENGPQKTDEIAPPCFILLGQVMLMYDEHWESREGIVVETLGDTAWVDCSFAAIRNTCVGLYKAMDDDVVTLEEMESYKPENISDEVFERLIDRFNNTIQEKQDEENIIDYDKILGYLDKIMELHNEAVTRGYDGLAGMWDAAVYACEEYANHRGSNSVCASITLQINQTMTMTRQAFRGTLTVENNSSAGEMKDVKLKIEVKDVDGNVATSHEFQINAESLEGFEGEVSLDEDWTLAQGAKGVATVLFIPTKYAAETENKVYFFGGSLSYIDPATEMVVTRELTPVSLTVKPSPNLNLTYFMQRDIFGDDAMTKDVVEPIIPAEFALLIDNEGYGDATKVKMVTDQPKIIENDKGLFVDFTFTSSQLNGQEKVLSLGQSIPTDFGTIPSRGTAYAQWWLECSLLGHFYEYDVQATHVTSYGNEDLSLLNNVSIHELIHSVNTTNISGEPLKGWLVNDEVDADDYPDMIYLSDATTEQVKVLRSTAISRVSATEYTLTVVPSDAGWNYGNVIDPTRGKQTIERVIRPDGTDVDLQNVWQTDRTMPDGLDPIYENRIHIADKFSNGGSQDYTIIFSPRPEVVLFVESVEGLPEEVVMESIDDVTIKFNKPIVESTLADNLKLTCQGKNIDEKPTITKIDDQTFKLKWAEATNESGYFTITVYTSRMLDQEGYHGDFDYKTSWNQIVGATTMLNIHVSPVDAGTTTPVSGEQTYGDEVTLTATPAYGYVFKDWLLDDEIYSTSATTKYIVESNAMFIAEFDPQKFQVTVDESEMSGMLTGAGTGSYDYKTDLLLTAQPIDGMQFVGWVVNGTMVSTSEQYTLRVQGPTLIRPAFTSDPDGGKRRAPDELTMTTLELMYEPIITSVNNKYEFAEGWNWFSFNPSDEDMLATAKLLESLDNSVLEIRGANGSLTKTGSEWSGNLTTLSAGESYQILLSAAKTLDVDVNMSNRSSTFVLSCGWNNVAYLPYEPLDINTALTNWDAKKNDIVKSQDAFAIFDGSKWVGTLQTMEPGQGYQLYSQANTTFYYPLSPVVGKIENSTDYSLSNPQSLQYADNMSLVAVVTDGEQEYHGSEYLLNSYINNAPNGTSDYIDFKHFVTLYGNEGDVISFDVLNSGNNETLPSETVIAFNAANSCDIDSPLKIMIATPTGIYNLESGSRTLMVKTTPTQLYILNQLDGAATVSLVDMGGKTIISKALDGDQSVDVGNLPKGVYVVIVKDGTGEMKGKVLR